MRIPHLQSDSLSTFIGKVLIDGEAYEFSSLNVVSEFDHKRRPISLTMDPLFSRNAETILLDNKERIDEINEILADKIRVIDDPTVVEQVPILDPGRIVFTRKVAQIANFASSNDHLDLKRVVDFSTDALSHMYRLAPLDTWAIFVSQDQDHLAKKLLQAFRRQIIKLETKDPMTKAPKVFFVPVASDEAGLKQAWRAEITLKVRDMSKMKAQAILLINPIMQDLQGYSEFRDHMRQFFATEV